MPDPLAGDVRPSGPGEVNTRQGFGRALTVRRERAGLTVRKVAKKVGQGGYATIGDWFAGRSLPSVSSRDLFVKVLRVCGVYDDESINLWLLALDRIRRPPGPRPGGLEPYRGLEPFQPEHADWFFGREALTKELVERLTALHAAGGGVQMVVGASGSGKSSLLRAGVIPAFRESRHAGAAEWRVPEPFTPGARPVEELARLLASMIDIPDAEVAEALRRDPMRCAEYVRQACVAKVGGNAGADPAAGDTAQHEAGGTAHQHGLVIVVDQFEEAFTACDDEDQRRRFIAALCAAATNPGGAVVVIGLRADFYAQALQHERLLTAVRDGQLTVGPMDEVELRDAIVEPARKARIDIEDGLVELLLREVSPRDSGQVRGRHDAGVLPLLSHALRQMWQNSKGSQLAIADYNSVGGISKAVATSADEVYNSLTTSQQNLARRIFLSLVHISPDVADTRRRVTTAELLSDYEDVQADDVKDVLDRFVKKRLITVHADTVEISHEVLLTAWPKLRTWLDTDRTGLVTGRNLIETAIAWNRDGRDVGDLYQGTRLEAAQDWAKHHRNELPRLALEFLDMSAQYVRRLKRRKRALTVALALITVLVVTVATALVRMDQQNHRAISQQLAARAHELIEANPRASALFAIAAWDTSHTPEAREAVLRLLNNPLKQVAAGDVSDFASNDAGNFIAIVDASGEASVRDISRDISVRDTGGNGWHSLTSGIGKIYRIAFGAGVTLAAAGERGIEIWTDPEHNPVGRVVSDAVAEPSDVFDLAFAGADLQTL